MKILVVDDDADMRELLPILFEPEGYEVVCASTAEEAMSKLDTESEPGLMFLDHNLEGMNGPELLASIRKYHPEILKRMGVVMVTGRELESIATLEGAQYMKKPVNISDMLATAKRFRDLLT